jgi:uncharacterized protein (DUF305 family)
VKNRSLLLILLVFVLSAFAVPSALADAPVEGRSGRAELRYMEGMIDHHQMAIDMGNDCLAKSSSEDLKTICQNIIDAQTAEIVQLQEWLLNWYNVQYEPVPMMTEDDGMAGMDHGHGATDAPHTDPPMMMGMMAGLNRVKGVEYDIAWAESMIDHHDDALHMSERLLSRVAEGEGHTDLRALAGKIIEDQTAEIETLESLIAEWGA